LVEPEAKLFIIMVRKGTDGSMICTAYDPKSSSDYLVKFVFGKRDEDRHDLPIKWGEPGSAIEEGAIEKAQRQLEVCVREGKLELDYGITPRVLCKIYNKIGGGDEYLGQAEVSISGVLSNCGQENTEWVTLIKDDKPAGTVNLSMSFKRQVDIMMENQAKEARKLKAKQLKDSKETHKMVAAATGVSISSVSGGGGGGKELAVVKNVLEKQIVKFNEVKSEAVETAKQLNESKEQEKNLNLMVEKMKRAEKDLETRLQEAQIKASESYAALVEEKKKIGNNEEVAGEVESLKKTLESESLKMSSLGEELVKTKQLYEVASKELKGRSTSIVGKVVTGEMLTGGVILSAIKAELVERNGVDPTKGLYKILNNSVDDVDNVKAEELKDVLEMLGLLKLPVFDQGGHDGEAIWKVFAKVFNEVIENENVIEVVKLFTDGEVVEKAAATTAVATPSPSKPPPPPPSPTKTETKTTTKTKTEKEETPLPSHWEERIRASDGKRYYVDHNTRKTQWKRPTV